MALREVAARELHNIHSVPKTLKPTFELMEIAHGFNAVVQDFEKWCRENLARHPKFPLLEYSKAVNDRLGVPSVPEAHPANAKPTKRTDDPRVQEIIQYVYDEKSIAPDAKKVASLIATYGFEYVWGTLRPRTNFWTTPRENSPK